MCAEDEVVDMNWKRSKSLSEEVEVDVLEVDELELVRDMTGGGSGRWMVEVWALEREATDAEYWDGMGHLLGRKRVWSVRNG